MSEADQDMTTVPDTAVATGSNGAAKQEHPASAGDVGDRFELHVKPKYILSSRAESLPPISDAVVSPPVNNKQQKDGKQSKKRRRNKQKQGDLPPKLCTNILLGQECSYGAEKCRFSHDIKEFLANRPEDIGTMDCPNYTLNGVCAFGLKCRFGSSHINMATGANLQKETVTPPAVLNTLDKQLQQQLRKRTYPFVCQRKDGKQAPQVKQQEATEKVVPVNLGPLPQKERKLIDFSNKIYIAPLTTVGNLPFRRVMKRFGADITCGEMALCTNLLSGSSSEWALLKRHPDEDLFGIQLAAGFPDVFTRTMEVVEQHVQVDFVDLNLGCPLDMVCNKSGGAALMLRDKRLKESLQGMNQAILKCPVTIKMRTGWDEKKPMAHQLVSKIQSWGIPCVAAVMVHGRSRLQRYSREANWEYLNTVASSQDPSKDLLPVIGNGDIMSYVDYENKVEKCEHLVNCAMLARGALIKPWLPTEIKERRHMDISATERLDILKDFVRFGLEHWGSDQYGVDNCRRFLLEWLSFLCRYVPVGILDHTAGAQQMNQRPPKFMCGRSDLETLFLSTHSSDWIKISEMLLGPVPEGFRFEPKHKANAYRVD